MLVGKIETLKSLDCGIAELVPDEELEEEIQLADEQMERVLAKSARPCGYTQCTHLLAVGTEPLPPTTTLTTAAGRWMSCWKFQQLILDLHLRFRAYKLRSPLLHEKDRDVLWVDDVT